VLAVVLLEREAGTARRTDVQRTAHFAPLLVLCYLHDDAEILLI